MKLPTTLRDWVLCAAFWGAVGMVAYGLTGADSCAKEKPLTKLIAEKLWHVR